MKSKLERIMEPRLEHASALLGWTVRRQVRLGRYVLDFLIEPTASIGVCVELDGVEWHERSEEDGLRDRQRDRWLLSNFGIPTIRFLGKEVLRNPDAVMSEIVQCASRYRKAIIEVTEKAPQKLNADSDAKEIA